MCVCVCVCVYRWQILVTVFLYEWPVTFSEQKDSSALITAVPPTLRTRSVDTAQLHEPLSICCTKSTIEWLFYTPKEKDQ